MEVPDDDGKRNPIPNHSGPIFCFDSKNRTNDSSLGKRNKDLNATKINNNTEHNATLDKAQLLSLFDGNSENLEYYCQLYQLVSHWEKNEHGPLVCDPRDSEKIQEIGNWKPTFSIKDIREVIRECESSATDLSFVSKQTAVDEASQKGDLKDDEDPAICTAEDDKSFHCGVHGCGETFTSLALYEGHYHRCHNYACASCRRSFVSSFLLDIHIQENHDSYFQILSSRIDMYRCLVESCDLKFRSADLRRDHLVTVHKFPATFSFHRPLKDVNLVPSPIDPDDANAMEVTRSSESPSEESHSKETSKKSQHRGRGAKSKRGSNTRVPTTVCFGRGSQRGFQRRGRGQHWHQAGRPETDTAVDIESVDMTELADSLS